MKTSESRGVLIWLWCVIVPLSLWLGLWLAICTHVWYLNRQLPDGRLGYPTPVDVLLCNFDAIDSELAYDLPLAIPKRPAPAPAPALTRGGVPLGVPAPRPPEPAWTYEDQYQVFAERYPPPFMAAMQRHLYFGMRMDKAIGYLREAGYEPTNQKIHWRRGMPMGLSGCGNERELVWHYSWQVYYFHGRLELTATGELPPTLPLPADMQDLQTGGLRAVADTIVKETFPIWATPFLPQNRDKKNDGPI